MGSRQETAEGCQRRALASGKDIDHNVPYYWGRRQSVALVVAYRMRVVGVLVQGLEG